MKTPNLLSLAALLLFSLASCGPLPTVQVQPTPTTAAPASGPDNNEVIVEGNVAPRDYSRILTRTGGLIAEVRVKKGDLVKKDDVLVRFDGAEQAQAALTAARLEEVNAQQALDKLNETADVARAQAQVALANARKALDNAQDHRTNLNYRFTADQVAAANAGYILAQDEVDRLQGYYDTVSSRPEDDPVRALALANLENGKKKRDKALASVNWYKGKADPLDIAKADADVAFAEAQVNDAQRQLDKTQNGPNRDDLALAQSSLENAKAQVKAAEKALADLDVKAPLTGTIVELDLMAGETLAPGQQVALVADLSELYVETNDLTELNVVKVKVGDQGQIRPDALPGVSLPAVVTEIANDSGKKGGDVIYTVRLKLNQADPLLRWGMTVEVRLPGK
ncbi:MAG TPA: efflux RND transporter periplasmic adaptor subunit [Anaerolineaceae bacterium]|nr:efflux RND transporter periplasmic adaptor subunit [Anaerolineaceae bacterium]